MVAQDVVYYGTVFICLALGGHYKKISNVKMKRTWGAGLGMLVACLVCHNRVYHVLFLVWGNVVIIRCCDKRYVHQLSLLFTWMYLTYLWQGSQFEGSAKFLLRTVALRLVGLAFEVNMAHRLQTDQRTMKISATTISPTTVMFDASVNPSAADIMAYAFFFIGIHRGPYYRYKTFDEHFSFPFGSLGDCRIITEQKIKKALVCYAGCVVLWTNFPISVLYTDAFYRQHGSDYRFLYCVPMLITFFLSTYAELLLSTAICTEAGFGVYPSAMLPTPGHGPTAKLSMLQLAAEKKEGAALEQEYNFSMLKCFENEILLIGPRMSNTLRCWDMPTRYWFWAYIYRSLVRSNKDVKTLVTFVLWSVWSGPSLQQAILSATLWVHVRLEAEYTDLFDTRGQLKLAWDVGFSIMRMLTLVYLTPCLVLKDSSTVLHYYHSLFWALHFVMVALIVNSVCIVKMRQITERRRR